MTDETSEPVEEPADRTIEPDGGPGNPDTDATLRSDVTTDATGELDADETELHEVEAALREAQARLLGVPAEVVVTNHVMGLYELAAIHLSADPPDLRAAALAIDAVAALVDGLGDRLGDDIGTLRDALANIRMAFVQVKRAHASTDHPESDHHADQVGSSDESADAD